MKFRCTVLEFSSKQGVVNPIGSYTRISCLLPGRCSPLGLAFRTKNGDVVGHGIE